MSSSSNDSSFSIILSTLLSGLLDDDSSFVSRLRWFLLRADQFQLALLFSTLDSFAVLFISSLSA